MLKEVDFRLRKQAACRRYIFNSWIQATCRTFYSHRGNMQTFYILLTHVERLHVDSVDVSVDVSDAWGHSSYLVIAHGLKTWGQEEEEEVVTRNIKHTWKICETFVKMFIALHVITVQLSRAPYRPVCHNCTKLLQPELYYRRLYAELGDLRCLCILTGDWELSADRFGRQKDCFFFHVRIVHTTYLSPSLQCQKLRFKKHVIYSRWCQLSADNLARW